MVGYADRAFKYTVNIGVSSIFTLVERADGEPVHPTTSLRQLFTDPLDGLAHLIRRRPPHVIARRHRVQSSAMQTFMAAVRSEHGRLRQDDA